MSEQSAKALRAIELLTDAGRTQGELLKRPLVVNTQDFVQAFTPEERAGLEVIWGVEALALFDVASRGITDNRAAEIIKSLEQVWSGCEPKAILEESAPVLGKARFCLLVVILKQVAYHPHPVPP